MHMTKYKFRYQRNKKEIKYHLNNFKQIQDYFTKKGSFLTLFTEMGHFKLYLPEWTKKPKTLPRRHILRGNFKKERP